MTRTENRTKVCVVCGKTFHRRDTETKANFELRKTCSSECRMILTRKTGTSNLKNRDVKRKQTYPFNICVNYLEGE